MHLGCWRRSGRIPSSGCTGWSGSSLGSDAEALDVLAQQGDEFGWYGDPADRPAGLLALSCSASGAALEAAVLVDHAVVGERLPGRGLESAKVRFPHPSRGNRQPILVSAATSDGRIIA